MTSPARKNPTMMGTRRDIWFWYCGVASVKPIKNRKLPMNMTGSWAKRTVQTRKQTCARVTHNGILSLRSSQDWGTASSNSSNSLCWEARRANSLRKRRKYAKLEMTMAETAFHPKCWIM